MRTILIVFAVMAASCGELVQQTGEACSAGTDCVWPAVCCSAPRIPAIGDPVPLCEDYKYCDAFLPFLVAGNPCNRSLGGASPYEQCSEGLVCCPRSLTCLAQPDCDALPPPAPPPMSPSSQACHADPDCPEGELCMGINMLERRGSCLNYVLP